MILKYLFFFYILLCVHLGVSMCLVSAGATGSQKRAPELLELEVQIVLPSWVLGTKLRTSVKAASFCH